MSPLTHGLNYRSACDFSLVQFSMQILSKSVYDQKIISQTIRRWIFFTKHSL